MLFRSSGLSVDTYHWRVQTIDQSYAGSVFSADQIVEVTEPFTEIVPGFPQVSFGKSEWADFNSDGKPDVVITGSSNPSPPYNPSTTVWFKGTGDAFSAYSDNSSLEDVFLSSVSTVDYDMDNDIDLFIFGRNISGQYVSRLYQNNGANFTSVSHPFGTGGQAAFGDVDNDGDIDVLINYTLYKKTSPGTYSSSTFGSSGNNILFDYDNDGDLDVYRYNKGQIYKNDGNGNFSLTISTLDELSYPAADVGDYDNDKDLDILVTGYRNYSRYSYIYRNNGDGTFSDIQANIRAVESGRILWIDYDNDGDLDVSMTGASSTYITRIFLNQGNDTFEPITVNLPEYYDPDINWADYDNDDDMDLIYNGRIATPMVTNIYRNNNNYPNPKPQTPGNLASDIQGQTVTLSWDNAFNPSDTVESMSYNVRVGTTPGGCDIISPQSDLTSGKPFVHRLGNAQMVTFKMIKNLPVDNYYWSVQALDKNSNYSSWASEEQFDINVLQSDFNATTACIGQPSTFTDESYTSGVTIDTWNWDFGDGATSTQANPQHTYASYGTYNVTLTIGSGGYSDYITKPVTINNKPSANFTATTVCQGTPTSFTNTTNDNGLTINLWHWDWGDTYSTSGQNPGTHSYSFSGDYSVTLSAQADNGCIDEITKTVSVIGYPTAAVSADGATTFCSGGSVTLTTPSNADFSYDWKRNGSSITGANINSYLVQISGSYTIAVTNKGLCTTTSSSVPVVVNSAPSAPLINASGPLTFCQGESVDLSVTDITGNSYQWKLNGGAVGANSNTYSATASGTYSLVVTNSSNCSANSLNTVDVVVNPLPTIPPVNVSGPTEFCQGSSVELSVASTGGSTYQWENNSTGITGATNNSYLAQVSGNYILRVTNSYNCSSKTENVAITVAASPSAPLISADGSQIICQGDSVGLSITPTSGYNYQWKLNGGTIGTNSHLLSAKSAGTYSLTVANSIGCSTNSTNTVDITVNAIPSLPTVNLSGSTSFCQGDSVDLSVASNAGYTYQWENSGAAISGANDSKLTASTSGVFALRITNTYNCFVRTENITVNVLTAPLAPTISAATSTTFCQGDSVLLSVSPVSGYSYQWRLNGGSIGTNSNSYTAKTSGSYDLVVANSSGCSASSVSTVPVVVNPLPPVSVISVKGQEKFCSGGSATLSVPVNANYSYAWKKGTTDLGLNTNTIDVTETGSYFVEIDLAGCTASTDPVSIEVISKPAKPDIDKGTYKPDDCLGETPPMLSVDNIVPGYTYQWYKNETPISSSTSIEVIESGNYYLEARYDICASERNLAGITFAEAPPKPVITPKGPAVWLLSTDSKADRYVWYYNGAIIQGASGSSFLAGQNMGLYRLAVANEDGCFSFSDTLRIPTGITGIEDIDPFENVKIYPNPTTGMFTIEMNNSIFGELIIDIFTQNGSKILNIKFQKTTEYFQSQIDLSGQSSGMYILNLSLDKFRAVRKMIVE